MRAAILLSAMIIADAINPAYAPPEGLREFISWAFMILSAADAVELVRNKK